jgi:hypothetical protein
MEENPVIQNGRWITKGGQGSGQDPEWENTLIASSNILSRVCGDYISQSHFTTGRVLDWQLACEQTTKKTPSKIPPLLHDVITGTDPKENNSSSDCCVA